MNKSYILKSIKKGNPLYDECESLCVVSKQLYNVGLYFCRQNLFNDGVFVEYKDVYKYMKENENWQLLPAKVSCQVYRQVITSWSCWFKALNAFKKNPSKFTGKPKIPKYISGKNIVSYENGAINKKLHVEPGTIRLSKTNIVLDIQKVKGDMDCSKQEVEGNATNVVLEYLRLPLRFLFVVQSHFDARQLHLAQRVVEESHHFATGPQLLQASTCQFLRCVKGGVIVGPLCKCAYATGNACGDVQGVFTFDTNVEVECCACQRGRTIDGLAPITFGFQCFEWRIDEVRTSHLFELSSPVEPGIRTPPVLACNHGGDQFVFAVFGDDLGELCVGDVIAVADAIFD